MNKSKLMGAACACIFAFITTTVNAALVTPTGLNPGDTYQLVFVTSDTINAQSADVSVYNAFAQAQAEQGFSLTGTDEGVTYKAVVSTYGGVDAIDNAPISAPVYLVGGNDLVAINAADFWDGTHSSGIWLDQNGSVRNHTVWTGTGIDGTAAAPGCCAPLDLALGTPHTMLAQYGNSSLNSQAWVNEYFSSYWITNPIYAISDVITVAAVPVPAALWLFGSGLLGLIGMARKKQPNKIRLPAKFNPF